MPMTSPKDSQGDLDLNDVTSLERASKVSGNTDQECKLAMVKLLESCRGRFGAIIAENLTLVDISVNPKGEDAAKMEGKIICDVLVVEGMLSPASETLHGGATAWIVLICTTIVLAALSHHNRDNKPFSVSQGVNIIYHGPAMNGDKLRITSTTISFGGRVQTASCEVWSATRRRLVATGTHAKMQPSTSKL